MANKNFYFEELLQKNIKDESQQVNQDALSKVKEIKKTQKIKKDLEKEENDIESLLTAGCNEPDTIPSEPEILQKTPEEIFHKLEEDEELDSKDIDRIGLEDENSFKEAVNVESAENSDNDDIESEVEQSQPNTIEPLDIQIPNVEEVSDLDNSNKDDTDDQTAQALIDEGLQAKVIIHNGPFYEIKGVKDSKVKGIKKLENDINENIKTRNALIEAINNFNNSIEKEIKEKAGNLTDSDDIKNIILKYVCIKTVQNISEIHTSEIYNENYSKNLFDSFVNGESDSTNPLFKTLINECLEHEDVDEYLGPDLTKMILKYVGDIE